MNILVISTQHHNPGDDFIRFGVQHILHSVVPDGQMTVVHKHDPRTLFTGFVQRRHTPHRLVSPLLYQLYSHKRAVHSTNRLDTADLIVFAGTPFIWRTAVRFFRSTSANAEWRKPIWDQLFSRLCDVPVINLSAGTSVTDETQYDAILKDTSLCAFMRQALRRSVLTTARDEPTQLLMKELGFDVDILPCASIMASKGAGLSPKQPQYVVINLMRSAAHSWRGQRGDTSHWRRTISSLVPYLSQKHKVVFVSHSADEDEAARDWFPQHPRFYNRDPVALLDIYSRAKFGVCNRVHSAAAIASFGRPAIVVGGDSRINLVAQFGLPAFDHRNIGAKELINQVDNLEHNYDAYSTELALRTEAAEKSYIERVRSALHCRGGSTQQEITHGDQTKLSKGVSV